MNPEIHVRDEALDEPTRAPWPGRRYRLTLTPGLHSARHVRRILRAHLAAWHLAALSDAAELGVTELLSNVVKHVPDSPCTVLLRRTDDGVRVEVHDCSTELPTPRTADSEEEGGRGLALLGACTDAWGAERTGPAAKTVWFELRGTPSSTPSSTPGATPR
ncbi:ATP-binding protein [Streptomyces sp. ODS28]|uniref:ATP-binding protein n=1 Tax=Streptomyces sp. ODS28 TaxID=3136688 RepID=UPI0031E86FBA